MGSATISVPVNDDRSGTARSTPVVPDGGTVEAEGEAVEAAGEAVEAVRVDA